MFFTGLALVLNINNIANFPGAFKSTKSSENNSASIKVMSWKVHNMQSKTESIPAFAHSMLQVINNVKPDIICLQEYYDQTNRHRNISDSLKAASGIKYQYFQRLKNSYMGIAISSRYPIANRGHLIKLGAPNCKQCIFADVVVNSKTYRIYNVHLQSYYLSSDKEEFSLVARTRSNFGKLKMGLKKRSQQAAELNKQLSQSPYPLVLTGDFNDTPMSYTYSHLSKGLNNIFREKGNGYGKTYIGLPFPVQIDYILNSPQSKVQSYQPYNSNHQIIIR